MQARNRSKNQRAEVNLDDLLETSEAGAYEALQLYRSRALRSRSKGDNGAAMTTTVDGAIKLIKKRYYAAAAELLDQFLDFLNELQADIANTETREMVFRVDDALLEVIEGIAEDINETATTSAFKVRKDFLKKAVKWSQACGKQALGDPALHVRLGSALWATDDMQATYHYVTGEAPVALAQKIDDSYGSKDMKIKRDRALTLGVCHFISHENLRDANELMVLFKKSQKNRGNAVDTKLITFCVQLLECCRRDATPLYKQLVNSVATDLNGWGTGPNADVVPNLLQGPIAVKFFGMQPKVHPMMQMMQQFLN
jgi:hypothetical protein